MAEKEITTLDVLDTALYLVVLALVMLIPLSILKRVLGGRK